MNMLCTRKRFASEAPGPWIKPQRMAESNAMGAWVLPGCVWVMSVFAGTLPGGAGVLPGSAGCSLTIRRTAQSS